jgi:propionate CoA-transferase
VAHGQLRIIEEGKHRKFVSGVEQVSFSGAYSKERGQEVLYVTERAVFKRTQVGLELIEIAPGVDVRNHILPHMDFQPAISSKLREMDTRLFQPEPMRLARDLAGKPRRVHSRLVEPGLA